MWRHLENPPSWSPQSVRQSPDMAPPAGTSVDQFLCIALKVGHTFTYFHIRFNVLLWRRPVKYFVSHLLFASVNPVFSLFRVALCKTPGCFLQSLSNPGSTRNFKQKKEELTSKLYQLYNTSVFDSKVRSNSFSVASFLEIFRIIIRFWRFKYIDGWWT